jgi:hypothetical protein
MSPFLLFVRQGYGKIRNPKNVLQKLLLSQLAQVPYLSCPLLIYHYQQAFDFIFFGIK